MVDLDIRYLKMGDGVFVHDHLIFRDVHGSWWAYRSGAILFSRTRDDLLIQVAQATNTNPDVDDLNGRLNRAVARANEHRAIDEALERAGYGKQR